MGKRLTELCTLALLAALTPALPAMAQSGPPLEEDPADL